MGINNPSGGGLWTLLHDETLAAAGSFDVSDISQGHRNLYLILVVRGDVVNTSENIAIFFNNDTTDTNYQRVTHIGGTTVADGTAADSVCGVVPAASSPASYFGAMECWIPLYTETTFNKICNSKVGARRDTADGVFSLMVVQWENTTAITRIALRTDNDPTDEFVANTNLQIWGVN